MWLSVKQSSSLSLSATKTQRGTQRCPSAGAIPFLGVRLFFFAFGAAKVAKTVLLFVGMVVMSIAIVLRVQILLLEGSAWLAVIMSNMMVGVAPAAVAWARARTRVWARRRPWMGSTLFSEQSVHAQWGGLVIVHGLITLHLEVIMFMIILSSHRNFSCSHSLCNESDRDVDHLNGDCHVIVCHDRVSCFDGSCSSCNDPAGSSNHGCKQREEGPFSSLLAAFSSWVCQGRWPLYWQFDTAPKRLWAKGGPCAPFFCFRKLALMQRRFVCSSLALWAAPVFNRNSHYQGSWRAALDTAWIHASA